MAECVADGGARGRIYLAIDLKSFYASAECAARGLDPLTTNLVVADVSRTEKTICLAVSPSMKSYGLGGRARLFEVVRKMREVNADRRMRSPGHRLIGASCDAGELAASPWLEAGYLVARPRMAYYIGVSSKIYGIYLRYAAAKDIHVYSIDEVFIDATGYLDMYHVGAHELAVRIVRDILAQTGITATAGIGTNMYLAKVAMDIVAKHMPADRDGVRVAELDELSYRKLLWGHRPLTDFWRVGRGYARRLEEHGLLTMGDIARCSIGGPGDFLNEDLLYRLFGVNAELLIDHAWGWEPCTMEDIKAYRPASNSLSQGQVLHEPYPWDKARLVMREMADALSLDLVAKGLVAGRLGLYVGYDRSALREDDDSATDHYGRRVPKPAAGGVDLGDATSSTRRIVEALSGLFDRIVDPSHAVRRITVVAEHVRGMHDGGSGEGRYEQLDLFSDDDASQGPHGAPADRGEAVADREKELRMQRAMLAVKGKFGKNAVVKAMNLEEGATGIERNTQIGGHAA